MMSISPERGHSPYVSLTGSIQTAGHNQSPTGSFAVTSTRPYLILAPAFVLMRADLTGLTIVPLVVLVVATQLMNWFDVHVLSLSRLIVVFLLMRLGFCSDGWSHNCPSLIKEFSSVSVVCSNWPLLMKE